MQIAGNGGYDMGSEHLHGHIEGHNLVLSKFETVKKTKVNVDGVRELCRGCEWNADGAWAEGELKLDGCNVSGTGCRRGCGRGCIAG